jgi:hypothetical protein
MKVAMIKLIQVGSLLSEVREAMPSIGCRPECKGRTA